MSFVLDASALVTLLHHAPGAAKVEEVIERSSRETPNVFVSAVNLGEVFHSVWRTQGREIADRSLARLAGLPVSVIDADQAQALLAAELKTIYRLPYADAFAAALAISLGAQLVTADADFQSVSRQVDILWLGKRPRR